MIGLPLVDQSATRLALTQAGIAGGIGQGVNVAGGSTQSLSVMVNGIDLRRQLWQRQRWR